MNSPSTAKALLQERIILLRNVRAPLLWLLMPYVGAIVLANTYRLEARGLQVLMGLAGLGLLGVSLKFLNHKALWSGCFLTGAGILGFLYANRLMTPSLPDTWVRTNRAGEWVLQVERSLGTHSSQGRSYGVARLKKVPGEHLQALLERKVYFSLRSSPQGPLLKGEQIQVVGLLSYIERGDNMFKGYLLSTGVDLEISRGKIVSVVREASSFNQWCYKLNAFFESALTQGHLPPGLSPLKDAYVAMLLGKKSRLEATQKRAYMATGSMHLFAISGLHIGVIAYVIYLFFKLFRLPELASACIGLGLLYLFVQIIGAPNSAERAFCMIAFYWAAKALSRQSSGWTAWVASALFMLGVDPYALFDIGFQLSYLVVASILLLGVPLSNYLLDRYFLNPTRYNPERDTRLALKDKCWTFLVRLLAFSFAANIVCAPLSAYYFSYLSFYGIVLNIVLIPLASLVIISGFLVMGLSWFPHVSSFLNYGSWVLLYLMDKIVHMGSGLPGAWIPLEGDKTWLLLGYGITLTVFTVLFYRRYASWKSSLL